MNADKLLELAKGTAERLVDKFIDVAIENGGTISALGRQMIKDSLSTTAIPDILSALQEAQGKWMPIETAPKDGTHYEVWSRRHGFDITWMIIPGDKDLEPYLFGGALYSVSKATHWRSIPAPPEAE